jgi:hypothetical protein
MYQPNQSKPRIRVPVGRQANLADISTVTQPSRLEYDQQFESELPAEIRRELEEPPPPVSRYPVRPPETEEEIQAAIAWLRSRGYLPPPTVPVPSQVQGPKPVPPERSSRGGWGLIWMIIGGFFLWALLHNSGSQPSASSAASGTVINPLRIPAPQLRQATAVDIRRAVPVIPRAESVSVPVASPLNSHVNVGDWHSVTLLDGRTTVSARFEGWLVSSADLPNQGHFLGEEFATGSGPHANTWIWLQPAGAQFASWVDP